MTQKLVATVVTAASAVLAIALSGGMAYAVDGHDGEVLYDLCQQCHGANGSGNESFLAPDIAGLDQWYVEAQLKNFRSGIRGLHPKDVGGMRMYPMSMWLASDDAVTKVAEYVANLPKVAPPPVVEGGDAEKGKGLYATCAACHGQDGKGNPGMQSPPLVGASDWYLYSQLQKFKAGIRGFSSKNGQAAMMRGMAGTLADDQAMKDVVAYISTLSH